MISLESGGDLISVRGLGGHRRFVGVHEEALHDQRVFYDQHIVESNTHFVLSEDLSCPSLPCVCDDRCSTTPLPNMPRFLGQAVVLAPTFL
jgi:hypothetical protein